MQFEQGDSLSSSSQGRFVTVTGAGMDEDAPGPVRKWDFCWNLRKAFFSLDLKLGSRYWIDCIYIRTVVEERLCLILVLTFTLLPHPLPWERVYAFRAVMSGLARWLALWWAVLKFRLSHVTCFGQWDVSRGNTSRGLKCACAVVLALCTSTVTMRRISQGSCCPLSPASRWTPACIEEPSLAGPHVKQSHLNLIQWTCRGVTHRCVRWKCSLLNASDTLLLVQQLHCDNS